MKHVLNFLAVCGILVVCIENYAISQSNVKVLSDRRNSESSINLSRMVCPPIPPDIIKNSDFSICNHLWDVPLTYDNVCEWFPAFGPVYHVYPSPYIGSSAFMALRKQYNPPYAPPAGIYQRIQVDSGQMFSFHIRFNTWGGGKLSYPHSIIDKLIVCFTTDSVELLSNGVDVRENFNKQIILELTDYEISYPPWYQELTITGLTLGNYNKIFIYTYNLHHEIPDYGAIDLYNVNLVFSNLLINAGEDRTIKCGDSVILGGNPTAWGGSGNYLYSWSSIPPGFNETSPNPVVFPDEKTRYFLKVTDIGFYPPVEKTDSVYIDSKCCFWPVTFNPPFDIFTSISNNQFGRVSSTPGEYFGNHITVKDSQNDSITITDNGTGSKYLVTHHSGSGRLLWAESISTQISDNFNNIFSLRKILTDEDDNTYFLLNASSFVSTIARNLTTTNHTNPFTFLIRFNSSGNITGTLQVDNISGSVQSTEITFLNEALYFIGNCPAATMVGNVLLPEGGFIAKINSDFVVDWAASVSTNQPRFITSNGNELFMVCTNDSVFSFNQAGNLTGRYLPLNGEPLGAVCDGGDKFFFVMLDFISHDENPLCMSYHLYELQFDSNQFTILGYSESMRLPRIAAIDSNGLHTHAPFPPLPCTIDKLNENSLPNTVWSSNVTGLPIFAVTPHLSYGHYACGNWPDDQNPSFIDVFELENGGLGCGSIFGKGSASVHDEILNKDVSRNTGNISIYPNPAHERINIVVDKDQGPGLLKISLISSIGENLFTINCDQGYSQYSLNLQNYPAGLYFLRLINSQSTFIRTIIKE